jgi:ribosomal protein S2
MKINKLPNYKNKLIGLKLIQTKIYKKNSKNSIKISDIIPRIKKAIFLIYKYHINNKRILFVGTPVNFNKKLKISLKNTKHVFIPESIWVNGILTNKESCFKNLTKNRNSNENRILEILLPLRKKSDLIVILDSSSNQNVLNEAYATEIPTITLNHNLDITDERSEYKIPGNFVFTKKKIRDNFFFSILNTTFEKANRVKNYINKNKVNITKKETGRRGNSNKRRFKSNLYSKR